MVQRPTDVVKNKAACHQRLNRLGNTTPLLALSAANNSTRAHGWDILADISVYSSAEAGLDDLVREREECGKNVKSPAIVATEGTDENSFFATCFLIVSLPDRAGVYRVRWIG
jgi:hypothetical protein